MGYNLVQRGSEYMENLDVEIGTKLKKLREQLNLTTREVGSRIDIDQSYVSKIEKGRIPSLTILKKLCDLYGVEVADIFGDKVTVPKELQEIGVKWMAFNKEMEKKKLSPEDVTNILEALKNINKL